MGTEAEGDQWLSEGYWGFSVLAEDVGDGSCSGSHVDEQDAMH